MEPNPPELLRRRPRETIKKAPKAALAKFNRLMGLMFSAV